MEISSVVTPPLHLRWLVALAVLSVCGVMAAVILSGSQAPLELLHTLCLLAMVMTAYAWSVFQPTGGFFFSAVVLLCFLWMWLARPVAAMGLEVLAFGVVVTTAAWQRRRWLRRFYRLSQQLEDFSEERTVKEQGLTSASQTREALQKKLSRYSQLQTIAEEFSSLMDLSVIAQLTVDRTFSLIGKSDVCLLFLVDQEAQELSLVASKKREPIATIRSKHGDQFDRYVLRTHRPLLVNDIRRDFRFTVNVSTEREVSSVIACPLLLAQSPEGVLRLDSPRPNAYTQDDLRFLDILLDLVATAVANAKLFARTQQLAMTDGLTGLTLRRPFLEQLTRELTRAARTREPVSLLMADVDHFKQYNDTFGHTAGDLILKAVAEVLRTAVPPGGAIARYGGEEFAVLLPRLTRPQAAEVAENIRMVVEQLHQRIPKPVSHAVVKAAPHAKPAAPAARTAKGRPVTVSLGAASFPDDALAELELIRIADQRLYQAKRSGRNRVCSS